MLPVRLPSYPVLPHPTPSYTRFFNQPTLFYPSKPPRLLPSYPMEPQPTWSYTRASCTPTLFSTSLPHPTQSYLIQPHPRLASSTSATLSYLILYHSPSSVRRGSMQLKHPDLVYKKTTHPFPPVKIVREGSV